MSLPEPHMCTNALPHYRALSRPTGLDFLALKTTSSRCQSYQQLSQWRPHWAQRLFSAPMSSSSPVCKITPMHTCDPRSGEAEAGGSWIWSHKNKIKWPILYTAASGVTHWHLSSSAPPFHLEQQSTVQETRDGSVQKRTRIQFLAPMQRLTTTCNSVPGDPAPSEDLPGLLHTQVYT